MTRPDRAGNQFVKAVSAGDNLLDKNMGKGTQNNKGMYI